MGNKFPDLLEKYLNEARRYLQEMVQASEVKDREMLSRAAHSLKSSSGALGLVKAQAVAQRLEDAADQETSDFEDLKALIIELKESFATIEGPLEEELNRLKAA